VNFIYRGKLPKVKSPYNLKWHPHVILSDTPDNRKRDKKVLFLVLPTKVNNILPIKTCTLPVKIRNNSYYLDSDIYNFFWADIKKKKIIKSKLLWHIVYKTKRNLCKM
jgi:hypothetical protein